MGNTSLITLLVLSLAYVEICRCSKNATEITTKERNTVIIKELGRKLRTFWSWIQQQVQHEDTFVGRCAGVFKKMRMVMNFVIFKLGVIVTTLAFLSVLVLKSLGLGVILLVISSVGLFAKFAALKQDKGHETYYSPPPAASTVHLHIHNKEHGGHGGHGGHYYSHDSGLYDRLGLNLNHIVARTPAEQSAIADLYRRVGLSNSLYGTSMEGDSYR